MHNENASETSSGSDILTTHQFDDAKLTALVGSMALEHGIRCVATPLDWGIVEYSESSPSIAKPSSEHMLQHGLLSVETAIASPSSPFAGLLLYECHSHLCDAELAQMSTESPVVIGQEGGLVVNRESPISMSVYLLAIDKTMQSLAKQMSPEFYNNETVSSAWLSRSITTLKGQPQYNLSQQFSTSMEN